MSTSAAWLTLLVAGVCEVVWAVGLKYAEGFSRLMPSAISIVFMVASVVLLAQAVKVLPLGTAYAVWTGVGAIGTALCGMWLFNEPKDVLRVVSILLIVAGIAGLKLSGKA
ncbi:MAG: quaternary ammonium compound efflux transporter SugE [Pseudomonadota bacterium]|jgi:quaternary ammonium compound-resistance protein SugE